MRPIIAVLSGLIQTDAGEFSTRDGIPRSYALAIMAAGGVPFMVPCLEDEEAVEMLLGRAEGLLITGGADVSPDAFGQDPRPQLGSVEPLRDRLDQIAVRYALARPDLPVLGVCRGIQALAVFAGGTLIQDLATQVPGAIQHSQKAPGWHGSHEIAIESGSLLAGATGRTRAMVNSYHHQAVDQMPDGFRATARTSDGVIEAMERPESSFCLGVQFHPELMAAKHPFLATLFQRFVQAAGSG